MLLRRTSGRACVRIGLATVALALAASPTALAVAEKPKPDALWQAFPLDPASKRPASPLLPPTQGRPEATTVTDPPLQPSEASRENLVVLAFATFLVLLATVVVLSGRRLHVRRHQRSSSLPLWQGVAWPQYPDKLRELESRTRSALVGSERRAAEPHPDVAAPRYRWADKTTARRSRSSAGAEISMMIHRLRRVVWTEDTAPAIIGAVVAVVVGVLLVYLIG